MKEIHKNFPTRETRNDKNPHIVILLAVLAFVLLTANVDKAFAQDDVKSLSPKKVVSLIYDDSSSMHYNSNPSWAYANYAMQTFTGLLNPNDTLIVTFMSDKDHPVRSDSSGVLKTFSSDRQATIDGIRKTVEGGNVTPFAAIDTAGKALLNEKNNDPSTQYWMVVITDGAFEKTPGATNTEVSQTELDRKISKYAGATAANNTQIQCIYMAIGDEKEVIAPTENEYVSISRSKKSGIVDAMSAIADTISGRYRLEPGDIKADGNAIKVFSPIPLLNIQVLTQNSDAKVKSVEMGSGSSLVANAINIASPDKYKDRNPGDKLFGNLSTITSENDYIDEGDYNIKMTKAVDPNKLVVLYEPALETRIRIKRENTEVADPSVLREGEKIDIVCDLVRMGTDKQIDLSELPVGLYESMTLSIDENGTKAIDKSLENGKNQLVIQDYELKKGETEITAETVLKGFAPLRQVIRMNPRKPVVYGIKPVDNDLVLSKSQLKGKDGGLEFIVTGDGEPLSKEEVDSLITGDSISLTKDGEKTHLIYDYAIKNNGHVVITPKATFLNRFFAIFRVPSGQYDVTVAVDKKTKASDQFSIRGYSLFQMLWNLVLLLGFLYLLYLLFFKHKFAGETLLVEVYKADPDGMGAGMEITAKGDEVVLHRFSGSFFLPGPSKKVVCGIPFYADTSNGGVILKGIDIVSFEKYGKIAKDPIQYYESIVEGLTPVIGDEKIEKKTKLMRTQRVELGRGAYYLYQHNTLYAIKVED